MKRVIGGVIQAAPVLDLAVNFARSVACSASRCTRTSRQRRASIIRWTESSTGAGHQRHGTSRCSATASTATSGTARRWRSTATSSWLRALQTDNIAGARPPRHDQPRPERQPQRRRDALRSRRQAVHVHGRPGPPRLAAEPGQRPFRDCAVRRRHLRGPRAGQRASLRGHPAAERPMAAAPATTRSSPSAPGMGGEVGANIQKVFSYGHRNGFGMAFDPTG